MGSSRSIPVIDLQTASATDFSDALITSSCAFLVGHDVSHETRRGVFDTGSEFFQLSDEEKEAVRWPGYGIWCGWQPPAAPEIVGDRVPDPVDRYEVYDVDNFALWPEKPATLESAWKSYYAACTQLTSSLMNMLIDALSLPDELRNAWTTDQFSSLLCNYYYEQPDPPEPGQVRLHAHSDHGGLTLLTADDGPGGLEVHLPGSSEWVPVAFAGDAMLVQAGDLLSRWTNRMIRGNAHRVVNPPREQAMTTRKSVVFFHHPSLDTLVEPAESCVVTSGRPALPALHTGEHCMKRQESYALVPAARVGAYDGLDGREL
jgi:isopenicillin N synthase-like dioxygenase